MRLPVVRSFRFLLFCRLELRLQFGKLPSVEVLATHQGEQQVIDRAPKDSLKNILQSMRR